MFIYLFSGSSFGSQKRDGNIINEQRSKLGGLIRKNIADVTAAAMDREQQLTERHGTASDRERSAFPGLPKKTLHPYYVQSIPLPLFYRLRDVGI